MFAAAARKDPGRAFDCLKNAYISQTYRGPATQAKITRESSFISQTVLVSPEAAYQLSAYVKGTGNLGVKVGTELFSHQRGGGCPGWNSLRLPNPRKPTPFSRPAVVDSSVNRRSVGG